MDRTIDYYNKTAVDYFTQTKNLDMSKSINSFIKYLPNNSHILDFGCGSGRDSLSFLNLGFQVTSIDGSQELCHLASEYIGKKVECCNFLDFKPTIKFDGIWACASLLHLTEEEFKFVLNNLYNSLNDNGIMYISLKINEDFSVYEGERFFTFYSIKNLKDILKNLNITILEIFENNDTLNRNNVNWINIILKK